MNNIAYSYLPYINRFGGMLASQLFQMLPVDSRPCYATFLKRLRATPGVYVSKAFDGSGSLYVCNIRKPANRTVRLNIMIAEWEIKTSKSAVWFIPEFALFNVYLALNEAFSSARGLVDAKQWLLEYTLKKQAVLTRKKASTILNEKPPVSLLNLYQRGIYLHLISRNEKPFIRFNYFDVLDDINGLKYKHDVAMIFEFLAYHEIYSTFDIVLYLWTDIKADIFEKTYTITESNLERINHKKIRYNYKPRHYRYLVKQTFVSLAIGTGLNKMQK